MKKLLFVLFIFLSPNTLQAQDKDHCEVTDCDGTITLNDKKLLPNQLIGKSLGPSDKLTATEGRVSVTFRYKPNTTGCIKLPAGETLEVANIVYSTYCTLDPKKAYTGIFSGLWNFFMKIGESPDDYTQRYRREHFGVRRLNDGDILMTNTYKTSLRVLDIERLKKLNDSLTNSGEKDSVVYYLNRAVFFEQKNYLMKAYDNYKNAYAYLAAKNTPSKAVTLAFQQFLYRMGRIQEGNTVQ